MFDVIILGGGPAGLSAALYARRYGLETLLIEELYMGGQIVNTHEIENYPGFGEPISGGELIDAMEKQVNRYGPKLVTENVKDVSLSGPVKAVTTDQHRYEGKTLIIATGQNPRQLGVAREIELRGKGVSYCATCDGNFFRGKNVAVVGGGDTAVTEANFLSRICQTVAVIHRRDTFRAAKAEVDKLTTLPNVRLLMNSQVVELVGHEHLESVKLKKNDGGTEQIEISGLFVAVGAIPNSSLFKSSLHLDDGGYIITDEDMRTGIEGVFAAGDIRRKTLRQVITAAADGAIAAHHAMLHVQAIG